MQTGTTGSKQAALSCNAAAHAVTSHWETAVRINTLAYNAAIMLFGTNIQRNCKLPQLTHKPAYNLINLLPIGSN